MKTITLKFDQETYPIYLGENLNFNALLSPYLTSKVFIITDRNLFKLYSSFIFKTFKSNVEVVIIKPGEKSKSFKTYQNVINRLLSKKIEKNDLIIAFGGGVVGDLAGFIAGSLFRGMKYIQIPTSLLAMADSSIGGKTGIDTYYGKNLVGLFKNPEAVFIDTSFLNTLPEAEYSSGMAEIIKAGLIRDEKLISLLQADGDFNEILYCAILVKKEIVQKDPFEKDLRRLLNFGHSFAHAIEVYHRYKIKHGYAVSMGMDIALKYGYLKGYTKIETLELFDELLIKYHLPKFSGDLKTYVPFLDYDKKSNLDHINFVIVEDIGVSRIEKIKKETFYEIKDS